MKEFLSKLRSLVFHGSPADSKVCQLEVVGSAVASALTLSFGSQPLLPAAFGIVQAVLKWQSCLATVLVSVDRTVVTSRPQILNDLTAM